MEVWLGVVVITVFKIEGDLPVLLRGPPSDPATVTGGAAELFGLDFGVGK
jgi:hypothetical protein